MNSYFDYRRSIYASICGKMGAMKKLADSTFLRKNEKEAALNVLDSLDNLRQEMQIVKHKNFDKENSESELEFNVTFNPFTKKANIVTKRCGNIAHFEHTIDCFDYWWSFAVNAGQEYVKIYDIHFHYDEYFKVSIYPFVDGETIYDNPCKVRLVICLKEKSI